MTVTAAAATVLLSLLGAASLTGAPALRAAADLAAAGVVLAYLRSPAVLARRAVLLSGPDRPAARAES